MKSVIPTLIKLSSILCFGIVCGCGDKREGDTAEIKKVYADFRTALINEDYVRAGSFISSSYLTHYPSLADVAESNFRGLKLDNSELRGDAWVRFVPTNMAKAWLFPRAVPTVGQEFVKETNGWKITVNVLPIMN